MKCTASAVIGIARDEVGYLEKKSNSQLSHKTANAGSGNYTKYARDLDAVEGFYNGKKQGFPWCDVFVDWVLTQAFGAEKAKALLCQPDKSYGAGVDWSARYFKQAGRLHTGDPKAGDQIFFLDSSGEPGHTGIVTAVEGGRVYTIEGNTSGETGVVDNGGGVWAKSYDLDDPKIYGYGRPDYDPEETETEEATEMRYNTLDEIPAYAKATIQKLMEKDYLLGTATGLDLSLDMIRMFVINDRAGLYD